MACPSIFDIIYGEITYGVNSFWKVTLNHSVSNLFETYIWTFALYVFIFMIGLFITMIYFRLNKVGQIIVSCSPIIFSIVIINLPNGMYNHVCTLIENIFGLNCANKNPYIAIITFSILSILSMGVQYLLIKKSVTDKN